MRPEDFDVPRPPTPTPGCPTCRALADRRETARLRRDGSAETDANVLLRRHQRSAHGNREQRQAR